MALEIENIVPETGEWTISLAPNDYIVVLENRGDTLKGIDRVAFSLTIGDQSPANADGYRETQTIIRCLRQVDGRMPGEEIAKTEESLAFLHDNLDRISAALNSWNTQPEDVKSFFWSNNFERTLKQILGRLTGTLDA